MLRVGCWLLRLPYKLVLLRVDCSHLTCKLGMLLLQLARLVLPLELPRLLLLVLLLLLLLQLHVFLLLGAHAAPRRLAAKCFR